MELLLYQKFQSTFPRGERQMTIREFIESNKISIHVPAWGTTKVTDQDEMEIYISIHVPAWGTT